MATPALATGDGLLHPLHEEAGEKAGEKAGERAGEEAEAKEGPEPAGMAG